MPLKLEDGQMCRELTVRLKKAVKIGQKIHLEGRIERGERSMPAPRPKTKRGSS